MQQYRDLSGNSGVEAFEAGADFIRIRFKEGGQYLYTDFVPGVEHVRRMKYFAESGRGLATYINQYVRGHYQVKEF